MKLPSLLSSSSSLLLFLVLSSLSSLTMMVQAQMNCNYDNAQNLDVGRFKIFIADMATTNSGFTLPERVNFHIFLIGGGTQPKWQSAPDGNFVEPRRNGDILRFYYKNSVGSDGQSIDSGIALWVPWDWIYSIATASSRGDTIKIQNVEQNAGLPSISVIDGGNGNRWKISSDSSPILFTGLSDNTQMEAKIKSGSQLFYRSNSNSRINLIFGNDLDVQMLGDNNFLSLVGRYRQINLIGANNRVEINDECNCQGCNNVAGTNNNNNQCSTNSNGFTAIDPPSCTISVTARNSLNILVGSSNNGASSSANSLGYYAMAATTFFGLVSIMAVMMEVMAF